MIFLHLPANANKYQSVISILCYVNIRIDPVPWRGFSVDIAALPGMLWSLADVSMLCGMFCQYVERIIAVYNACMDIQ